MVYLHQSFAFFRYLYGVIDLHGHHRGKVDRFGYRLQRVAAGHNADEFQTACQRPHHHHFACNIVKRHAEQSGVALM